MPYENCNSLYPTSRNPLFSKVWFKNERHNATNEQAMFQQMTEESMSIYGTTCLYFPVSIYSLDSIAGGLWGEDNNKKYLERYTLVAMTDGENDVFSFNDIGTNMLTADRTLYISKKMFAEVTGKREPYPSDHILWTQNNVVYEVLSVDDNEGIVLGMEMQWKLTCSPRIIEGTIVGLDDCSQHEQYKVDDLNECEVLEKNIEDKSYNKDGNVIDKPELVMENPRPRVDKDQEEIIPFEKRQDDVFIRNAWGKW